MYLNCSFFLEKLNEKPFSDSISSRGAIEKRTLTREEPRIIADTWWGLSIGFFLWNLNIRNFVWCSANKSDSTTHTNGIGRIGNIFAWHYSETLISWAGRSFCVHTFLDKTKLFLNSRWLFRGLILSVKKKKCRRLMNGKIISKFCCWVVIIGSIEAKTSILKIQDDGLTKITNKMY